MTVDPNLRRTRVNIWMGVFALMARYVRRGDLNYKSIRM